MAGLGYVEVIGFKELEAKFRDLGGPMVLKMTRQGIMAGLVPLAKAIRQQVNATSIPPSKESLGKGWTSRQKKQEAANLKRDVRQAVGRRMVRARLGATKSKSAIYEVYLSSGTQGKAGFAVGKRQPPREKREGAKGVGLSASNVHWFVMGTKDRYIKSGPRAGQWTGKIRPYFDGVIATATMQSAGAVREAMALRMKTVIESKARKGR